MNSKQYTSNSEEETDALAETIAKELVPGNCIALDGELGAGKTRFVRGLVKALGGAPRQVSSPTFVLLNVYDAGKFPLYHLDAYRLLGPEDFEQIGFEELLEQPGIVVVEWASKVRDIIPPAAIHIDIQIIDLHTRRITVT